MRSQYWKSASPCQFTMTIQTLLWSLASEMVQCKLIKRNSADKAFSYCPEFHKKYSRGAYLPWHKHCYKKVQSEKGQNNIFGHYQLRDFDTFKTEWCIHSAERIGGHHTEAPHNHLWKAVEMRKGAWGLRGSRCHPDLQQKARRSTHGTTVTSVSPQSLGMW